VSAEPGDVIFFEGAPSKDMVFVIEGELEVIDASGGGERIVGLVPRGAWPARWLLRWSPRSRHVRAKTACELRRLTREGLLELMAPTSVVRQGDPRPGGTPGVTLSLRHRAAGEGVAGGP